MNRPTRDVVPEARRNLLGGAVGERHGADPARRHPVMIDEALDPPDQAERLAGARPGHDEHGAEWRFDGAALLVERREAHMKRSDTTRKRGNRIARLYAM